MELFVGLLWHTRGTVGSGKSEQIGRIFAWFYSFIKLLLWSLKRFCPGSDPLPLCWHDPDISRGRSPPWLPCLTWLQVESPPGWLASPLIRNLDKLLVQREVVADGILKILKLCRLKVWYNVFLVSHYSFETQLALGRSTVTTLYPHSGNLTNCWVSTIKLKVFPHSVEIHVLIQIS